MKAFLLTFEFKFQPEHWERVTNVKIIDADGWPENSDGMKDWDTPITREDFMDRAVQSTAEYPRNLIRSSWQELLASE